MLFENNPMSMICSLVCNHENQCEGHCVLGRKGEPVHISSIENYVSDTYFDKMQIPCQPKNGKKVAVTVRVLQVLPSPSCWRRRAMA